MITLMLVVLVIFSLVKTKIIHYSSMTYLPLTYLAAVYLDRWIDNRSVWRWWNTATTIGLALVWSDPCLPCSVGVYGQRVASFTTHIP